MPLLSRFWASLPVDLVLGRAGEGAIGLVVPQRIVVQLGIDRRRVDRAGELFGVLLDAATADVLQIHHVGQLVPIDCRPRRRCNRRSRRA